MRVLVIDHEGQALDFCLRCLAAGHDVRWFQVPSVRNYINSAGKGISGLTIVDEWQSSMKWAKDGLVLLTGNFKYLAEIDRYREMGWKVFGPTVASAALEIKRSVGMKAMEDAGIEVPHYETFNSLADAYRFSRKADKPYVFKTMGDEDDKAMSYVACEPADLAGWIGQKIERGVKLKGPCMLQEKIDMLCELGVSGWFGPDGFFPDKWQVCVEHKKLYPGEIGQNTGEQGTVCQYVEDDKLALEMLIPMVGALRKAGHRGDFAVGVGIDTTGKAWPFEFTARCGWPAFHIQVASHKGDPAQWMRDLLDGKDTLRVSNDVAIGVVLSQPDYPTGKSPAEKVEGHPISGLDEVWDDIHPIGVRIGKGPKMDGGKIVDGPIYETTSEYVAVATGLGKTVEKARRKVYGVIDKVKLSDMGYRNDIGEKVINALPKLHRFGYALDLS